MKAHKTCSHPETSPRCEQLPCYLPSRCWFLSKLQPPRHSHHQQGCRLTQQFLLLIGGKGAHVAKPQGYKALSYLGTWASECFKKAFFLLHHSNYIGPKQYVQVFCTGTSPFTEVTCTSLGVLQVALMKPRVLRSHQSPVLGPCFEHL